MATYVNFVYKISDKIYKKITNSQGHFKISWSAKQNWTPSDTVLMDSEGAIHWHIDYPFGILIKYPCGTKRFIKHEI